MLYLLFIFWQTTNKIARIILSVVYFYCKEYWKKCIFLQCGLTFFELQVVLLTRQLKKWLQLFTYNSALEVTYQCSPLNSRYKIWQESMWFHDLCRPSKYIIYLGSLDLDFCFLALSSVYRIYNSQSPTLKAHSNL